MSERGVRALDALTHELRKLRKTTDALAASLDKQANANFALRSTIKRWFGDRTRQPVLSGLAPAVVDLAEDEEALPCWCLRCSWVGVYSQFAEHRAQEHAGVASCTWTEPEGGKDEQKVGNSRG